MTSRTSQAIHRMTAALHRFLFESRGNATNDIQTLPLLPRHWPKPKTIYTDRSIASLASLDGDHYSEISTTAHRHHHSNNSSGTSSSSSSSSTSSSSGSSSSSSSSGSGSSSNSNSSSSSSNRCSGGSSTGGK